MKADCTMKINGVWYKAGDEIPEKNNSPVSFNSATSSEKAYTKTEINRMSTADLQTLATEQGIENADEVSGSELKKMLIEKFGL